jgi:hypothetical protein
MNLSLVQGHILSVGGDALRVDNCGSEENQRTSSPTINHVNQKIEMVSNNHPFSNHQFFHENH